MRKIAETPMPNPTAYFFTVLPELCNWNSDDLQRNVRRKPYHTLMDLHCF